MKFASVILASLVIAGPAIGEPVDTKAARGLLFPVKGQEVRVSGALSPQDQAAIRALIPLMEQQLRQPVKYFAAIAYSPDEGLASEALQGAFNYHTAEAATTAAIAACNAARKSGTAGCAVAAQVLPKGYEARPLTLSRDATEAFDKVFRRERGSKSFAISAATGGWGTGETDAAALAACAQADCTVVIRD